MFGNLSLTSKIITAISALAVLYGGYLIAESNGYRRAMGECEHLRVVQELANREASRLAAERLMREADELSLKNMELDDALAAIDEAAAANPDGDRVCLASDSVGRLQSIR